VILTAELQLTKLRSGNFSTDSQGGVMTREIRLLTPIFAIAAIIVVNLPMRTLAYETAKLPAASDEILTTEISAAQKKYQQPKRSGGGAHKFNKSRVHKSAKVSGGHKSNKFSSGGHKSNKFSSGGHKSNKFSSGGNKNINKLSSGG
jgi:hypothetical protein